MDGAPALQRAWLRRGPLACGLWPLSLLFALLAALRRLAFRAGLLRTRRVPVPVLVVGNVLAGGTGKTPIVIELVKHLRERGWHPGVVSRGHGRRDRGCREVRGDSTSEEVGDEPLLIARTADAAVFVAPSRVQAAHALLAAHPECDIIVSDDGLQHYALARDLEICVFDERGTGNGWLLPAGPLRERWPRRADLVLRPAGTGGIDGYDVRRELTAAAHQADGSSTSLAALASRPVAAVAAIGRPQAFFDMLRAHGISPVASVALPDHDPFANVPAELAGRELVCTEKDAVKLWRHRPDAWAVPLRMRIDPAFWTALDHLLGPRLSSRHGLQTS